MKHNVILVVLDGLNYEVARHAMGHLQAYVGAGRAALYKLECELPALSRPLYECILTGVTPIDSGIVHNNVSPVQPAQHLSLRPRRRPRHRSSGLSLDQRAVQPFAVRGRSGPSHRQPGTADPARAFLLERSLP